LIVLCDQLTAIFRMLNTQLTDLSVVLLIELLDFVVALLAKFVVQCFDRGMYDHDECFDEVIFLNNASVA